MRRRARPPPAGCASLRRLAQLHQALKLDWLPPSGASLFFYDIVNQPWGFDPKDRGSWRVVHVPIDSDDDLDAMWGDLGRLYFWVRASASCRADFADAWLVLQCS